MSQVKCAETEPKVWAETLTPVKRECECECQGECHTKECVGDFENFINRPVAMKLGDLFKHPIPLLVLNVLSRRALDMSIVGTLRVFKFETCGNYIPDAEDPEARAFTRKGYVYVALKDGEKCIGHKTTPIYIKQYGAGQVSILFKLD